MLGISVSLIFGEACFFRELHITWSAITSNRDVLVEVDIRPESISNIRLRIGRPILGY